jgi:hypothetical protein
MMPEGMPEMAKNFMAMMGKPNMCQKKTDQPKTVDQMTYDEQLAHAMKLSMEDTKPVVSKKSEAPKPKVEKKKAKKVSKKVTKKVSETPKTSTPRSVSDLSFEQQLAEAMRLSLEDTVATAKKSQLEDDVVIMVESDEAKEDDESSDNTEDLYTEETPKPEAPKEEPKEVVIVEEVDPVVLSNTT